MATDHPLNCLEQLEDHHDWECSTCAEDFHTSTSPPWYTDDKFLVCSQCIRSRFQAAVDSGVDWPARWGGIALDVEHYRNILDDELYNAYIAKAQDKAQEPKPSAHEIPEGLTLGVDIQRCPGCKKLIGLIDGCNHIVCELCMKNFCFICGEEALDDGSNHWAPGGCPRYGLRDSARAIYDNVVDDQEEEEEEEEVLPPWLIVGGDGAAIPTLGITNFNMAMQTSTPETQNVLRRFVDRSRPVLAEEDFRIALRAMGTNHPLSGIPDHDWYSALFVASRRAQHRRFLIILLIIAFESEDLPDQLPPPEKSYYARVPPLSIILNHPLARTFDMGTAESRRQAYRWIATQVTEASVPAEDPPRQGNSALLTNILGADADAMIIAETLDEFDRFHAHRLTDDSVLLHVRGGEPSEDLANYFGDMVDGFEGFFTDDL